ncbi:MAG: putative Zn-dependent protease [Planctomycetota bacterium]|jgi:predicted Zn-dependent protease
MRNFVRLSVLSLFLLSGCGLNFYTDEQLEPLSVQAYAEATTQYPEVTSGRNYEMVQEVARRIAAAAEEDFPWEAKLLKADDVPNAFCLPNGRIAIYTGILDYTKNIDGLAAVMGHEVAHATLRHGGQRMTQNQIGGTLMAVADAGMVMAEMESGNRDMAMGILGLGAQYGVMLPYSRGHESEADVLGIRYAIRAGFNPDEAPLLWERMATMGSGGPEWMSTHPDPLERAKKLREMIPRIVQEESGWSSKPTKKVSPGAIGR